MEEARVWLWRAVVAVVVVLLVTGIWLTFFYRPSPQGSFGQPAPDGDQLLRVVHRVSSATVVPLSLLTAAVNVSARRRSWPAAASLFLLVAAASFTGYLLPWDQLALWAVTVGTDMRGMFPALFDDRVKFVLIGGVEVDQGTLRSWFIVHAAVLPVLLTACLVALRRERAVDRAPL